MSFGNKVLQLRKEKNWSQTELGKEIKTSAAMVGKYERNEINPSIEVAKKLSETFSVTIDYLINDSGENDIFKAERIPGLLFYSRKDVLELVRIKENY